MDSIRTLFALLVFVSFSLHADTIEDQIREFAAAEYPSDSKMQGYVYRKQLASYNYLLSVQDAV